MAKHLSDHNFRSFSNLQLHFQKPIPLKSPRVSFPPCKFPRKLNRKWAVKQSVLNQNQENSTLEVTKLIEFLYEDLPHLFDDQGIDRTMYDDRVEFRDPITKHDTISGYLFNIDLLKKLFQPDFQLHYVKQLRIYKTPSLETPKYQILKRAANYEVRKYAPFVIVETKGDKLSGSTGFNDVAGYIFGKNSAEEKIPMTTPVFTQSFDDDQSKISIQIVLPTEKNLESLPEPNKETLNIRKVEGGIAAVLKFSGKPTEDVVREKERELRNSLIKDGLKPIEGCMFARYNDPGRTWNFIMRNEVLIWLEDFTLD